MEPIWKQKLIEALSPEFLEIRDDSHKHRNHEEAKSHGGGHYTLTVVSANFTDTSRMERQKMINGLLENEFKDKKIHALKMVLKSPEELT